MTHANSDTEAHYEPFFLQLLLCNDAHKQCLVLQVWAWGPVMFSTPQLLLHTLAIAIQVKTGRMQSYGYQPNDIVPSLWFCIPGAATNQTEHTVIAEKQMKHKDNQS